MTSLSTLARTRPQTNGSSHPSPDGLVRRRRRQLPLVSLGVLVIVGGALAGLLLGQSAAHRTAVLVAARDIPAGHRVSADDVISVDAAVDSKASLVPASNRSVVVGQVARSSIPSGALLSPGEFSGSSPLRAGEAVATVLLAPGTVSPSLAAGDQVQVIRVAGSNATSSAAGGDVLTTATVFSVDPLSGDRGVSVSLIVPDAKAAAVADAASASRVRLAVLPTEGG